jgi:hypothetical protein
MKKRLRKKIQKERIETYRGITLWEGWAGPYSYLQKRSQRVMIMLPTIEFYAPDFTQAKLCVDHWHASAEKQVEIHKRKTDEAPF